MLATPPTSSVGKTDSCCSPHTHTPPSPRSPIVALIQVFRSQDRSLSRAAIQDHFTGMFVEGSFPYWTPLSFSGPHCGRGEGSFTHPDVSNNVDVFLSESGMCGCLSPRGLRCWTHFLLCLHLCFWQTENRSHQADVVLFFPLASGASDALSAVTSNVSTCVRR